ncbi:MAG: hypothetical protein WA324_27685 [Bryobacteraceae bacterium]
MAKKTGAPTKLNAAVSKIIVDNIRKHLSITNAARVARLSPQTPLNWLKQGESEKAQGLKTIHTEFLDNAREAQGLKISEMLEKIEAMPKGWQAIAWYLEKCCAEDFGKDSELYKQLLEDYKMLMQSLVDQNKGVNHGRKMDSESKD